MSTRSLLASLELHEHRKMCALGAQAFQRSPQRSARRHSFALHSTPRTVRRILHEDLKFHRFRIQLVQQIPLRDLDQRSECCRKLLQMIERTTQKCKDVPYLQWSSTE